ncbi:hypothetical protein BOO69_04755 [Sulfitobacter alexandrii]|uniref:Peptidase S74 domain-containing protein n=1 Tax=Sulfitobacter alexandrii TaxID=1917485 RepID=A0A1J0WER3_9RHOB|nr:hypothetical protein [Sulfitobacter alexandrii]APE42807.1 hypothetical protein BOO69_04755 [Sulfitobacter alexandrii]
MTRSISIITGLVCAAALVPSQIAAQNLNGQNLTLSGSITQNGAGLNFFDGTYSYFDGSACFGNACESSGSNGTGNPPLKLKWTEPSIILEDTSTASFADRDWRIHINGGGTDSFAIDDEGDEWEVDDPTTVFTIEGGAPANAFWMAPDGDIGLGTSIPQADLHIVDTVQPSVRLDYTGTGPQNWEMQANGDLFSIAYQSSLFRPFAIFEGAPTGSLIIDPAGNVGFGTGSPEEKLHIVTTAPDTDSFALFDAQGPGSDSAFRIRQKGLIPTTWEFRNQQSSGRLNVGIAGGNTPFKIDNLAANNLLRLGRNGRPDEVVVTGTLVVNNTDMNVPDYVFADHYALRSLAEVRAFIDANSHLPEVPSEAEIRAEGVDLTQMQMTQLKKIEELTLYTLAQEDRIAAQEDRIARQQAEIAGYRETLSVLARRLDRLEAGQ